MKKLGFVLIFVFTLLLGVSFQVQAQVDEVRACHPVLPNDGGCNDGTNPCTVYSCEANPNEGINGQPSFVCVEKEALTTEEADIDPSFCGEDDLDGLSCSRPSCSLDGQVICNAYMADQDNDGLWGAQCGGKDCDDNNDTVLEDCPVAPEFCGNGIVEGDEECEIGDDFCNATCTYNRGVGEPCDHSLLADFGCALIGGEYLCEQAVDFDNIECEMEVFQPQIPAEVEGCGDGFVNIDEECEFGDPKCNLDCQFNRGVGEPCNDEIPALFNCEEWNGEWICDVPVNFDVIECEQAVARGGELDFEPEVEGVVLENNQPEVEDQIVIQPQENENNANEEVEEFVEEEDIEVVEDSNNIQCLTSGNEEWVSISLDEARHMMDEDGMFVKVNGDDVEIRYNANTGMIEQKFGCLTLEKAPAFQFTGSSCQLTSGKSANAVQAIVYLVGILMTLAILGQSRKLTHNN